MVMKVECFWTGKNLDARDGLGGGGGGEEEPILTATKPKHRRGKERMREKGH